MKHKIIQTIKDTFKPDNPNQFSGAEFSRINRLLLEIKLLDAKVLSKQNMLAKEAIIKDINKAEFKVFSQWGDDGIIQFLVDYLEPENKIFIEFGVENYEEANSKFLMMNNGWKGMVMDSSADHINHIKNSEIFWQYHLDANQCFVTRDNINGLIQNYLNGRQADVMIIDIDGNDYWIWEAIVEANPTIVVTEYNSLFGPDRAITIPYKEDFSRQSAHYSHLYYGASLAALVFLAHKKGYELVACNSNGNNAFFVRKDKMKNLKAAETAKAFYPASFRESRNHLHQLSYLNFDDAQKIIAGLPVYNVIKAKEEIF